MAVVAQYRFAGKDLGLLAILFPSIPVMKGPHFPPFVPGDTVIVVTNERRFARYPDKNVIQITSAAAIALDTRAGFVRVLPQRGVKATDYQLKLLLSEETSEEEFWREAKIATVLKRFPSIPRQEPARRRKCTVLALFKALFEDFEEVYRCYQELRKTRTASAIRDGLFTMMSKARNPRAHNVRPYYRAILLKNHRYLPVWLMALKFYYLPFLNSERSKDAASIDWVLLSVFAACSGHVRRETDEWFGYFPTLDWELRASGFNPESKVLKELFAGAL